MLNFIRRWQNCLMAMLLIAIALVAIRLWPHASLSQLAPSSTAVYDDHGHLLRLTLANDQRYRQWVPLKQMPPALVDGVMLHEDAWFRWHPGFNPISLARGAFVTYVRGGNRQGGSTLTMQLARLVYRLNTRTPGGKLRQVLRAVQLELCYSKDAILEAYLNYAPYGRNIEGAGAASLIYFDKPVQQLTLPEALTLAVIPQDPSRRIGAAEDEPSPPNSFTVRARGLGEGGSAPEQDQKPPSPSLSLSPEHGSGERGQAETFNYRLSSARSRLFARWIARHPEDKSSAPLMQLPLRLRAPENLPFAAPHFVEEVLADAHASGATPAVLRTTLDLDLQHVLERQLKNQIEL